jgi:mannose-6-phosphate isomerase-like protein (cupin superfamily)
LVQSPRATCIEFDDAPPSASQPDGGTWLVRAANFVVAYSRVQHGTALGRTEQPDEYMVYLVDTGATVSAAGESVDVEPGALVVVPPGDSRVVASGSGQVVRIFTTCGEDLAEASVNAERYADRPPGIAELGEATEPAGGHRLLTYRLADHPVEEGGFRVFRSGALMVNLFGARTTRRNPGALSPHWHEDFEQGSVVLEGTWEHHLRYPWVPDMTAWRDDEHLRCGAPSVTIIPARVEHTSQDLGEGRSLLIDVFAPPRQDFCDKGLVLNMAHYEAP